ncbi:SprT-like protein [Salsuginibacillus halophilus]|uniref:SprT-like protein n=2 Tax=Salsuginibacillus halophilus TaxID=517424 RepID=A0A2P8H8H4_9BACI|nr:SprT-like protein [Salsuginibacillus halophilus]
MLQDHTIEVNPKHLMLFGEQEIIDILKHELCHYHLHLEGRGYRHKDPEFKALLAQVGGARFCQRIPEAKQTSQARHVYVCTLCYEVYVRKKRMNLQKYRCGVCRGLLKQKEVSYEKK